MILKRMLIPVCILFFGHSLLAQEDAPKNKISKINTDTTLGPEKRLPLRVVHADKHLDDKPHPAIFIDGHLLPTISLANSINANMIESINVIKRDTLIDNVPYEGQVFLHTKGNYDFKWTTLSELKKKYTDFKDHPVVFIIDDNFVTANYDHYIIDENNLLTIIIDNIELDNGKLELGLIKLLTRREENIENRKRIMIRGSEGKRLEQ